MKDNRSRQHVGIEHDKVKKKSKVNVRSRTPDKEVIHRLIQGIHDIQAPLYAIKMVTSQAHTKHLDDPSESAFMLGTTKLAVRKIEDLISIALRPMREPMRPVDAMSVHEVSEHVNHLIIQSRKFGQSSYVDKTLIVSKKIDSLKNANVRIDQRGLQSAIHNLIGNAYRHSSARSKINIHYEIAETGFRFEVISDGVLKPDQKFGIGMRIVNDEVTRAGGYVSLISQPADPARLKNTKTKVRAVMWMPVCSLLK